MVEPSADTETIVNSSVLYQSKPVDAMNMLPSQSVACQDQRRPVALYPPYHSAPTGQFGTSGRMVIVVLPK